MILKQEFKEETPAKSNPTLGVPYKNGKRSCAGCFERNRKTGPGMPTKTPYSDKTNIASPICRGF